MEITAAHTQGPYSGLYFLLILVAGGSTLVHPPITILPDAVPLCHGKVRLLHGEGHSENHSVESFDIGLLLLMEMDIT